MKHLAFALLLATGFACADTIVPSPDGSACVRIQEKSLEVIALTTQNKSEPITNSDPRDHDQPLSDVSVVWSPDSTKVAISYDCKRSNDFALFQIKDGKVIRLNFAEGVYPRINQALPKNKGRYSYEHPLSWTKEGKLNLSVEGETITIKEDENIHDWFRIPVVLELKGSEFVLVSIGQVITDDQYVGEPRGAFQMPWQRKK